MNINSTLNLVIVLVIFLIATPYLAYADSNGNKEEKEEEEGFVPGSDTSVRWKDYERDFSRHKSRNRPAFLYFYSSRAFSFCETIETKYFADNTVRNRINRFECFKIDADSDHEALEKFEVERGSALILIIDFQGQELKRYASVPSDTPSEFARVLSDLHDLNTERVRILAGISRYIRQADQMLRRGFKKEAYEIWAELIKHKDDIISEELDELVAEYNRIVAESERKVEEAIRSAQSTIGEIRPNVRNARNQQTLTNYSNRVTQEIGKINKIMQDYPLPAVSDKVEPTVRALHELNTEIMRRFRELEPDE